MTQYRVLPSREWFTLAKLYVGGETVELPESEAKPFVGSVFEGSGESVAPVAALVDETTNDEPPVSVSDTKTKRK